MSPSRGLFPLISLVVEPGLTLAVKNPLPLQLESEIPLRRPPVVRSHPRGLLVDTLHALILLTPRLPPGR